MRIPPLILLCVTLSLFVSYAVSAAATTDHFRLSKDSARSGDKQIIEFRARKDDSHTFVVIGFTRNEQVFYTHSFGFYPKNSTIKSIFYGPGELSTDSPKVDDKKFRAFVTDEEVRKTLFVAQHVAVEGRTYAYPLLTCVQFVQEVAAAIGLDVGVSLQDILADPNIPVDPHIQTILRPLSLVERLSQNNGSQRLIDRANARSSERAIQLESQRQQELRTLRTTPAPRRDDNPVGRERMREMPKPPLPIPAESPRQREERMNPMIPK